MKLWKEFEKYWKTPCIKSPISYTDKLYTPSQVSMNNRKEGAYHVFVAAFEMGLNAAKELPPLPKILEEKNNV
jgi:hypothetical protein